MYYPDLSPYSYGNAGPLVAENVGWLEYGRPFPAAAPTEQLLDALWALMAKPVARTRGCHHCDICEVEHPFWEETYAQETRLLGSAEIRVFHSDGRVFAAPTLIFHYIREHHYDPPKAFKEAVLDNANNLANYFRRLEKWTE